MHKVSGFRVCQGALKLWVIGVMVTSMDFGLGCKTRGLWV